MPQRHARVAAPHVRAALVLLTLACLFGEVSYAQKRRRPPASGRVAVVVDERLAALRDEPELTANLLRRLGRGSLVALTGTRRSRDGVEFHRVVVTRRTGGWLQAESVVSPARAGDDERLLRLVRASEGFDRVARARIFLETFPRSPARPAALLLLGEAAEEAAPRLSREAARRLDAGELAGSAAPTHSYFMNYNGLDRYRRQGVVYTFDRATKQYRYDGAAWREILRRHPRSVEAEEARRRLNKSASAVSK